MPQVIRSIEINAPPASSREMFGPRSIQYRVLLGELGDRCFRCGAIRSDGPGHPDDGVGFQTAQWRDDEIMGYVRALPEDAVLYTDDSSRIYFATGHSPHNLPLKYSIISTLPNQEYLGERPIGSPTGVDRKRVFHSIFRSEKGTDVLTGAS